MHGLSSMGMGGGHGGNVGMGGMNGAGNGGYGHGYGHGPGHGHHQQHRNQAPVYNPHQHVHYPYQPQPLDINPQTTRGMPYTGPGVHHYAPGPSPMNGMAPPPHHGGPMSVNHTGMTQMSSAATGFQTRGMTSPMPMSPSPMLHGQHGHGQNFGMHQHQQHHGPVPHHMHQNHAQMGHHGGPGHMGGPGMGMGPNMGMNMPYQGQTHMHVGLGAGPMGAQNGMGLGMGGGGHGHGHGQGQMGGGMGGVGQYGSGPHPGLSVHSGEQGALGKSSSVWITGEFFGVQRARDMLLNVAVHKVSRALLRWSRRRADAQSKLVISRDTAILPRKLDWLLTERIEEFKTIMSDNGTYVQVPAVGSQASLITVFGDHRVNIERTIRSIMSLVSHDEMGQRGLTCRPASSTSPRSGSFRSRSTCSCLPPTSTRPRCSRSSRTSRTRLARRSSSRAIASRCTAWSKRCGRR